jgi:uncharacterized protein YjbI with pentapeptide repeats
MQKIFLKSLSSVRGNLRKNFKLILIALPVTTIFFCLWLFQQKNIDFLDGKIRLYENKITQLPPEERLKLEKDILGFEKDKTTIQNGAYTTLVQALGGLILSVTAWVGYQNFRVGEKNLKITEDKQVTERFSKSIEHLGNEKIDIILGGIYALEQIAIDSSKYHWTIVEILSAFIREKCPIDNLDRFSSNSEEESQERTTTYKKTNFDIQAALTVLGRRKIGQDPQGKKIDLRKVKLPSVEIREANLSGADLSRADLRGADLRGADLRGADLIGANLRGADLIGANLRGANLSEANLSEAKLSEADLSEANLSEADLSEANLSEANLSEANLSEANLFVANLIGANLSGTNLIGANLIGVRPQLDIS